jgi:hypothetical protein
VTRRATSGAAPLVHGLDDASVRPRNTASPAGKLRARGVPIGVRLLPGENHGAILGCFARSRRADGPVDGELVRFLRDPPRRRGG